MNEKDTPERINRWNEIMNEIVSDTTTFTKDMKGSINFVAISALGNVTSAVLFINLIITGIRAGRPPIYLSGLLFGLLVSWGLCFWSARKYFQLKTKYNQIFKHLEDFGEI